MRDSLWDNQTSQFCKGQTQVLITTDIMARNSHLMQKVSQKPLVFTQVKPAVNMSFLTAYRIIANMQRLRTRVHQWLHC